ncbi:MAG: polysulfide reductase NrfD [Saprospiraceae bacterium]|nr:polysulfide reductase NrfD [Saprospiraceae bacterium]
MDLINRKNELVGEFYPQMIRFSSRTKIWIGVLILIILAGFYALYFQISRGHEATGMRNNVVWGVYIVNFIFFVTISYSGAFISGVLHFYETPWKNSLSRILEIITVLSLIIGPVFILLCIGRLDRLHYLFLYPRIQSPITWDIIAIMTDLIGCFVYLYITFIPDLAILRDYSQANDTMPEWRKKLYKLLSIGYKDTEEQRNLLEKTKRRMSTMIIALAIVAYTVLAWIFSLTLQPGWNSTIFAPYFIIAGLYSGVGLIIICMYIVRKYYKLESYINKNHFIGAGVLLIILGVLFGYFTFSQYFPMWFSSKINDIDLLNKLFSLYFWQFIGANYIGVLVPILIILFKKLRTINFITFGGVVAVLALWLNRYFIVVPTLETPYIPIQDTRQAYLFYYATWVEWALTLAGFATFCLLFTLILKLVPVVHISDIINFERKKKKSLDLATD